MESPFTSPLPGEIVQQIVYDLIAQSGLTYAEAVKVLAFVIARLLYSSEASSEVAGEIAKTIPEGILVAYQRLRLYDHEPSPGQKPN